MKGGEKPSDLAEAVELAADCYRTKRYATSGILLRAALEAEPKLGANMAAAPRYNAACACVAGGGGKRGRPEGATG